MYDLYNESAIAIAASPVLGKDTPLIAWSDQLSVQLQNGTAFPFSPTRAVPDWVARDQRHAYYAAISYVDEHVGALLAQLDAEGLAESTIVVFHSDHGYHLGEHGYWEKKSNFDMGVRVPLIMRVPGKKQAVGAVASSFVDLVDVWPTLAKLAGLPPPPGEVDGDDFSALFDDPSLALKSEAFHQYPACGMGMFDMVRGECNSTPRTQFNYMGYSMRNAQWRYTRWLIWNNVTLSSEWDGDFEEELYSHAGDNSTSYDAFDNENVAAANPAVVALLSARGVAQAPCVESATTTCVPVAQSGSSSKPPAPPPAPPPPAPTHPTVVSKSARPSGPTPDSSPAAMSRTPPTVCATAPNAPRFSAPWPRARAAFTAWRYSHPHRRRPCPVAPAGR
jgi:hypothetical protein